MSRTMITQWVWKYDVYWLLKNKCIKLGIWQKKWCAYKCVKDVVITCLVLTDISNHNGTNIDVIFHDLMCTFS